MEYFRVAMEKLPGVVARDDVRRWSFAAFLEVSRGASGLHEARWAAGSKPRRQRGLMALRLSRRLRALSAGIIFLGGTPSHAAEDSPIGATDLSFGLAPQPLARLVGSFGGGGGAFSRAPSGFFVGADTGWAVMLGPGTGPAPNAWAFGGRLGYEWQNGLAVQARFDDLGVEPPAKGGPVLFGSAGVRYSLPLIVMPFAEALIGPAFNGTHAAPGAALGLGASLPVVRHLMFDLAVRDWIVDLDGAVRNIPTIEAGITVGFTGT